MLRGTLKAVYEHDSLTGAVVGGRILNQAGTEVGLLELEKMPDGRTLMRVKLTAHTQADSVNVYLTDEQLSRLAEKAAEPPMILPLTIPKFESPGGYYKPKLTWHEQQRQQRGRWHR